MRDLSHNLQYHRQSHYRLKKYRAVPSPYPDLMMCVARFCPALAHWQVQSVPSTPCATEIITLSMNPGITICNPAIITRNSVHLSTPMTLPCFR